VRGPSRRSPRACSVYLLVWSGGPGASAEVAGSDQGGGRRTIRRAAHANTGPIAGCVYAALVRDGWTLIRYRGSHRLLRKASRTLIFAHHDGRDLGLLVGLVAQGRLRPQVGLDVRWRELVTAAERLRSRQVNGKVVLRID
jgi:predicted RNA binding protein YcfA (HicA-like mRNA interferase family)